jgi:phage repressor protein C with HTH and peptisase S24 domain
MSQRAFGELLGIPQTTYANYESGKAVMPDELKKSLADMGINLHWLITGNGPMTLDGEPAPTLPVNSSVTYMSVKGSMVTQEIPDGGLSVPILIQKLSAGPGQEWTDADIIDGERLQIIARFIKPWQKDRVFAAEVRGDSMTGIQLFDGDMVFFVHGEVEGDGLYVLTVDNEVFVKRIAFNPFEKKVTIKSENDRYDPMTVDADRIVLLGKVIGWLHHHPY